MKNNSFVKAGAILVISGFVVKILSAVYRIPLTRMLGATAMGRYSIVFSLFMPFFSFATAGIIPTTAHFAARHYGSGDMGKIAALQRKALWIYTVTSIFPAVAFVLFARWYSLSQGDNLLFYGAVILCPTIVLGVWENVFKGATQGRMNMLPTAVANMLESVFKAVVGLSSVYLIKNVVRSTDGDLPIISTFATVTVSGFLCCFYLVKATYTSKNKEKYRRKPVSNISGRALLKMSLPIAVSALTVSLVNFFDTAFCLPRLEEIPYGSIVQSFPGASFKNAGEMSVYLFGVYQGMSLTVFNLLPAVISSIASAGLPAISRNGLQKDKISADGKKLFSVTAFIAFPTSLYMYVFRRDIIALLFGTDPSQSLVASDLLGILLLSAIFCCFNPVLNCLLYAVGQSVTVFRILVSASAIKCILNYMLCVLPNINIRSFAVSAAVFYTIIFILSIAALTRQEIKLPGAMVFLFPLLGALCAMLCTYIAVDSILCWLPLLLKLIFSATIYGLIYLLFAIIGGFFVDISL